MVIDNNSLCFYEKGDYLVFCELILNYNLFKIWISKVGMIDVLVYVIGQNLFYIIGYIGVLFELVVDMIYGCGIDNGCYFILRIVLFGLLVIF